MRASVSGFLGAGVLSAGLLVAVATQTAAQTTGLSFVAGSLAGGPVYAGDQQRFASNPQLLMSLTLSATLCRNVFVETQLSGMALKNSDNADVKRFAEDTITEGREFSTHIDLSAPTPLSDRYGRSEGGYPVSDTGFLCASLMPNETRQAVKQMKKLTGTKFDRMYLVQMEAYVKNDREVGRRASALADMPAYNDLGMRATSLAQARETRIGQLAAEGNFCIQ